MKQCAFCTVSDAVGFQACSVATCVISCLLARQSRSLIKKFMESEISIHWNDVASFSEHVIGRVGADIKSEAHKKMHLLAPSSKKVIALLLLGLLLFYVGQLMAMDLGLLQDDLAAFRHLLEIKGKEDAATAAYEESLKLPSEVAKKRSADVRFLLKNYDTEDSPCLLSC